MKSSFFLLLHKNQLKSQRLQIFTFALFLILFSGSSLFLSSCSKAKANTPSVEITHDSSTAEKPFTKIKSAQLTSEGIRIFKNLANMTPNIDVKDAQLLPIDGYAIWIGEEVVIVAPFDSEAPEKMSSSWERRTYPWPDGKVLESTCWCKNFEEGQAGDDCEFDDTNGSEPINIQCVGSCDCNRTDIFKPGPVSDLLETITAY